MSVLRSMSLVLLIAAGAAVSGCATDRMSDNEAEARQVAEQVVRRVLVNEYPAGYPVVPAANCAIDNATDIEVFRFVEAEVRGITGTITQMALAIMRRPETVTCLKDNGVPTRA